MRFAKGHGTGNDFVIVPDAADLPREAVAFLCDRRRGIGGDGLIRVVRTDEGAWYMDYRNADGSLAEMCGNGVRVYARYLVESGLATGPRLDILTAAGPVVAIVGEDEVAVDMPPTIVYGRGTALVSGVDYPGTAVTCGNPNLVCRVDDPAKLDLTVAPVLDPDEFPAGANVEFVGPTGSGLRAPMRVVERGVGETLSCGSGACAVAAVVLADAGLESGVVGLETPGGLLTVTLGEGRTVLSGAAVIVATGEVSL
jgi:diaminopimelate epimerase